MFEFSRELKRLFSAEAPRDGLTGGQAPLLELLDLTLLRAEARSADIAAGRISAKDPAQRSLEAAHVWREMARRTGDAVALRKAAAAAQSSVDAFQKDGRTRQWAQARCEQAIIAMIGAELFGDEGLRAAADFALNEVIREAPHSAASTLAKGRKARLTYASLMRVGDATDIIAAGLDFDDAVSALEGMLRNRSAGKAEVIEIRADRVELFLAAGARLGDCGLLQQALDEAVAMVARLDSTYEPLTWVRAQEQRGAALTALGSARGQIELITEGVAILAEAIDTLGPNHSPLDWARLQHTLGLALRALAEASDSVRAFDQAIACFDRSVWALRDHPALILASTVAYTRADCLARRAELTGDLDSIEAAIDALKVELGAMSPGKEPVAWAVCQVNLARLYETRMAVRGVRRSEMASAILALSAAFDVFAEHGLRSLSDDAARALQRLCADNDAHG